MDYDLVTDKNQGLLQISGGYFDEMNEHLNSFESFDDLMVSWTKNNETIGNETGYLNVMPFVMGFIVTFGLIFNVIAILINCVLGDYKKTSHWYVLNLAIADSIFLLMLPLGIVYEVQGNWALGTPLCKAYVTMFYGNYYAGIFFLTAMSFDRYVAILYPMSSVWRKFRSREGCWSLTAAVWILALAASFPLILNTKVLSNFKAGSSAEYNTNHCDVVFHKNETEAECIQLGIPLKECDAYFREHMEIAEMFFLSDLKNGAIDIYGFFSSNDSDYLLRGETRVPHCDHVPYPAFITWIYTNFILTYVVPVVVMTFCYGCILWRVLHPRIPTRRGSGGSRRSFLSKKSKFLEKSASKRTNHRVTILVVLLVVAFLGCWTPFHAVKMAKINGIPLRSNGCRLLTDIAHAMAYSNSLLNPLLYTFLGANFRKRAEKFWSRIRARNSMTKEFFASFRNSKSSARTSAVKTNKVSSSDAVGPFSTNVHAAPAMHKREECSTSV